jgi:hypothetical protein
MLSGNDRIPPGVPPGRDSYERGSFRPWQIYIIGIAVVVLVGVAIVLMFGHGPT